MKPWLVKINVCIRSFILCDNYNGIERLVTSVICILFAFYSCESMEPNNESNRVCEPKGLFIKDRKQEQVELRFNNLYYTVSLGFRKGESLLDCYLF